MPDARLLAAFPETTRFCRVFEPKIDAPEMELVRSRVHTAASPQRHRAAGQQGRASSSVRSPFESNSTAKATGGRIRPEAPLTPKERTAYLANAKGMTATSADSPGNGQPAPRQPPRYRRNWSTGFSGSASARSSRRANWGTDSGDEALLHQKGSPLGRAEAFATLCRAAKIPARLVTGFEIKTGRPTSSRERGSRSIRRSEIAFELGPTIRRTASCRSWTTTSSPCGATAST